MSRPLCFVLMPYGRKPDAGGRVIDFDAVYRDLVAPAIAAVEMEPLRAHEEMAGGILHEATHERLILCEYAVADLTVATADVFYDLGLRQGVRPSSTVLLSAEGSGQLLFAATALRAIPYRLAADGIPTDLEKTRAGLVERLQEVRRGSPDSPVFELVEEFPEIQRLKTDVFRERVEYSESIKNDLAEARRQGLEAVQAVGARIGKPADAEAGVVIDLFLSYRAVKAWEDMIALVPRMSAPLAATVLVQEQLALALNRAGRGEEAERILLDLIARRGPSSETYGILGRVYKDGWEAAQKEGNAVLARGLLDKAITAYLKGFEADWRDAYPGINVVTLMELKEPPDPRRQGLIPVVRYAVERRITSGQPDYWDHATLVELAVLAKDEAGARSALSDALALVRENWEPETTARNLRLIRRARENRGEVLDWVNRIETTLATHIIAPPKA